MKKFIKELESMLAESGMEYYTVERISSHMILTDIDPSELVQILYDFKDTTLEVQSEIRHGFTEMWLCHIDGKYDDEYFTIIFD
jgi:hypothetical protein